MIATLDHRVPEAENIESFWFSLPKDITFQAGQYIEMHLAHKNPDSRGEKRWFTVSSSPTDLPLISITTKFANPSSSFKAALRSLQPGATLDISEPMGDFVLPKDPSIPLIFVAGGIGITPFHSIIKFLSDSKIPREIEFLYSVRLPNEKVFNDLIDNFPFSKFVFLTDPNPEQKKANQLNAEGIIELFKPVKDKLIYVSGPEPMVEKIIGDLEKLGIPKAQLVGDYFPNYKSI